MHAAWWWIDRWRKSTAYTDMTLAEMGAYRNLLDELWLRDGVLPDNDRVLGKIAGSASEWPSVKAAVMGHFRKVRGGWRNDTHDAIQRESQRLAAKQQRYRDRLKAQIVTGNVTGDVSRSPSPSPYVRTERVQNTLSVSRTPRATPKVNGNPEVKTFIEWFQQEYKRLRNGADYLVKWPRDAPLVKQMLHATTIDRLKLLARVMLSDRCAEDFIINTDRGIGILSLKFNWLSDRVAEWESKQQTATHSA